MGEFSSADNDSGQTGAEVVQDDGQQPKESLTPLDLMSGAGKKEEKQEDAKTGRPENLPDNFWDEESKSLKADELLKAWESETKRSKGLRDKLANGAHKAPEEATEYVIEFGDDVEEGLRKIDDPILDVTRESALKAGLSKEQYNAFMASVIPLVNKMGIEAAEKANAPLSEEQVRENFQAMMNDLGPGGERVVEAVDSFISPLKSPGALSDSEKELLNEIVSLSDGVRILNLLRASYAGDNFDVGQAQGGKFGWDRDKESALRDLMVDPRRGSNPGIQSKIDSLLSERERFGITGPLKI